MHSICLYTVTGQDEEYTFADMIWQNITLLQCPQPCFSCKPVAKLLRVCISPISVWSLYSHH